MEQKRPVPPPSPEGGPHCKRRCDRQSLSSSSSNAPCVKDVIYGTGSNKMIAVVVTFPDPSALFERFNESIDEEDCREDDMKMMVSGERRMRPRARAGPRARARAGAVATAHC